jgi:hypothetical protein
MKCWKVKFSNLKTCANGLQKIISRKILSLGRGEYKVNDKTKYILENELSGNVKEALNSAAKAIYFNDNSDYLTALWEVVSELLEGSVPEDADNEFINELVDYLNPHWNNE